MTSRPAVWIVVVVAALVAALTAGAPMSDLPADWTVEIDFTNGPMSATETWTDVTADVVETLTVSYGAQRSVGRAQPGTGRFTLDNSTGDYSVHNSAGTYHGDLKPRRRVRIKVGSDPVARGFVESWGQTYYGAGGLALVDVTFVDAFTMLHRVALPDSTWDVQTQELIDTHGAEWWYKFDETAGTVLVDHSGQDNDAHYTLQYSNGFGTWWEGHAPHHSAPLMPVGGGGSYDLSAARSDVGAGNLWPMVVIPESGRVTGTTFTLSAWVRIDRRPNDDPTYSADTEAVQIWRQGLAPTELYLDVDGYASSDATMRVVAYTHDGTNERTAISNVNVADGTPHHLVFRRDGTAITLWVDGEQAASGTLASNWSPTDVPYLWHPNVALFPRDWYVYNSLDYFPSGAVDDMVMLTGAVSDADIAAWYAAGAGIVEPTSDRVTRVLDDVGWPAALRDIDTGTQMIGGGSYQADALELLHQAAVTEGGALFQAPDGDIRFLAADHWGSDDRAIAPQARVTDTTTLDAYGLRFSDIAWDWDDTRVVNVIDWEWADGVVHLEDATSITDYGRLADSVTTGLRDAATATIRAQQYLDLWSQPRLAPAVTVPIISSTDAALAMALRIGDMVHLYRQHTVGDDYSALHHIEAVEWRVGSGADQWVGVFRLSPATHGTESTGGGTVADNETWPLFDGATLFDGADTFWH